MGSHTTDTSAREASPQYSPIGVVDLELSQPLAAIEGCDGFLSTRALVRLHDRPVGWLYLSERGPRISAAQVHEALVAQLGDAIQQRELRRGLDASTPTRAELPGISVVVCTRDRTAFLERALLSLLALDYPSFEIVVVDNAPATTDTELLVTALRASDAGAAERLRYVKEPRPGLDWARNRGWAEARHDIVAYTDDDVRVDRCWLHAIARAFDDAAVQLVTGLVVPAELASDAQVIFEDWCGGMGKGMQPRDFDPARLAYRGRLGAHHLGVGANMALRRTWLQRLGGFDTALDVGTPSHGAGDLDIFHRTLAAMGVARYEPSAIVRHYHRREMRALRRQLRDNGRAFGVYLLTRWSQHERPRGPVVRYALGTWLRWMLGRIPRRLRKQERLPLGLQLQEWIGMLESPWAWRATLASDRRVRSAAGGDAPPS